MSNRFGNMALLVLLMLTSLLHACTSTLADCPDVNVQCSQDCSKVNFCPTKGGTGVQIRSCSTDNKKSCSTISGVPRCDSHQCNAATFPAPVCGLAGAIPSPYSCYSYFICASVGDKNPTAFNCPDQQVFSPTKRECWSGVCLDGPKFCTNAGDTGVIDVYTREFCYYCDDNFNPLIIKCKDLPIPLPPPPSI